MEIMKTWKQKTKSVALVMVVGTTVAFAGIGVSAAPAAAEESMRMCYLKHPDTGENVYFKRDKEDYLGIFKGWADCSDFYLSNTKGKDIPKRSDADDTICENFTKRQGLDIASDGHSGVEDICMYMDVGEFDLEYRGYYSTAEGLEGK